jgi:hypothetical protein
LQLHASYTIKFADDGAKSKIDQLPACQFLGAFARSKGNGPHHRARMLDTHRKVLSSLPDNPGRFC